MSQLRSILTDLREKRLWPVAVVLLVALVAVPVALSRKPAPSPPVSRAGVSPSLHPAGALPVVSVQNTPGHTRLPGRGRDPFTQQHGGSAAATAPTNPGGTTTSPGATSTSPGGSGGASGSASGGSGAASPASSGGSGGPSGPPARKPPAPSPKPVVPVLSDTESYHVSLAITNSSHGFDTIDGLQRLSPLPSPQKPLLVDLGVLKGGRRVLFAVQPGAVLAGRHDCIPGPLDCELVSIAPGAEEQLSLATSAGRVPVAIFQITAIGVQRHKSAAAAAQARRDASAAGAKLIHSSRLPALSLFAYRPGVGAVVDLRTLTVGGK